MAVIRYKDDKPGQSGFRRGEGPVEGNPNGIIPFGFPSNGTPTLFTDYLVAAGIFGNVQAFVGEGDEFFRRGDVVV